jgi:hypothetical protein
LNKAADAPNAGSLFGSTGFDNVPFMIAWFMPQESSLQFGSLNCAADDIIGSGPAFPEITS